MSYDVTSLKSDISSILHGTTTNQVTNFDGLIYRAARQVLLDVDPQETKRITQLPTVFTDVFDYACPTDLKGNKVIDIFPQVNRQQTDIVTQAYNQQFDIGKQNTSFLNNFTILFNTGVKTIRINEPGISPAPIQVNECDSITNNGTWIVADSASNLSVDYLNSINGTGALKFDLASSGSVGLLENSTMNPVDLSNDVLQGTFFLYVYLPTGSAFSSFGLIIGSDTNNIYSMSTTVTQENTAFQNGWNLLSFPWANASTLNSPDPSALSYIQVGFDYDGTAQTGVRLDQITESLGQIMNIEYYSKYMFRNSSTGAFQETITADSNLINLDMESYNLLTYKTAEYAVQQQQGLDATFYDGQYFSNLYKETLFRYQQLYKSEVQKPSATYYQQPKPQNNLGRRIRFGF